MYNDDNKYFSGGVFDIGGYKSHFNDNTINSVTGSYNKNKYDSYAKKAIENWYEENLLVEIEEVIIEDTVWCNDRRIASNVFLIDNYQYNAVPELGIQKDFIFSTALRIFDPTLMQAPLTPDLSCLRDMDKFTVNEINGNGELDYPVGMITSHEAVMAGNLLSPNGQTFTTSLTLADVDYSLLSPAGFLND